MLTTTLSHSDSGALSTAHHCAVIVLWGSSELQCNKTLQPRTPLSLCLPAPKQPELTETASKLQLCHVPVFSKNNPSHTHTLTLMHPYSHALWHTYVHMCAQAHRCPPLFTARCICMQMAYFETIWSHSGGFAWSVPLLGENIAGAEWKLHFAGANISLGLWKIPFKWSQAEKRQRICLVFCLTVFSAYTQFVSFFFFFRWYSTQEGPGNTDVEGGRAMGAHMMKYGAVWLSVHLSEFLLALLTLEHFNYHVLQLMRRSDYCLRLCLWFEMQFMLQLLS